ncbi:MAG: methyltransferase domain-containing protein [Clostridia bacterium]|nr:methyltransferase domain-containing protein [Clostridia bacterium]
MENDVISFLRCPVCGANLERRGGSLYCLNEGTEKKHCFDLSASGYSDLSGRNGGAGDPKSAVSDRTAFLNAGYYAPLADEIVRLADKYIPREGLIVDEGCGEGYYSERLTASRPEGFLIGVDLSKYAADRASRRRRADGRDNSFYAVASIFNLPIADGCANGALCMFSPVSEAETLRVLTKDGVYIVGSAGEKHLYGLKKALYDDVYLNDPRADLPVGMTLAEKTKISYSVTIENNADICRLFGMTPYRFRTPASAYEKLTELEILTTVIEVEFRVYKGKQK